MKPPTFEGVLVALLPQRGNALLEVLRQAAKSFLGDRDPRTWAILHGPVSGLAGGVAFRLASTAEAFPWRDGGAGELARLVSQMGAGRCWAVALQKVARPADDEAWGEGVAFDRGERTASEESEGAGAAGETLAWLGEQLSMSENEVIAALESPDQAVGVLAGEEAFEDEIDQILDRARREFQRYRELKTERERGTESGE